MGHEVRHVNNGGAMKIEGLKTVDYEERQKESRYRKKLDKVMTEKKAVETFLHDGDSFALGGFFQWRQPMSVVREIIRQKRKHLSFIDESGFFGMELLVGAGALDRLDLAYFPMRQVGGLVGLPSVDRCLKEGEPRPIDIGGVLKTPEDKIRPGSTPLKIVDWTNFEVSLRFMAGALNVPFMPCRSSLGTDIPKHNKEIKVMDDPYENKPLLLVPAYKPDVVFIPVQRADRRGNGQVWGFRGTDYWKARAAKHVVLLTEELVPAEKTYENPGMTLIPAYCTDAVVPLPYNCHPSGLYGRYVWDMLYDLRMLLACQTSDGFSQWLDEWIYGCEDHSEYCDKVGWEKLDRLAKAEHVINTIPL
jgi:glutaconate CoA-transferase subunit A